MNQTSHKTKWVKISGAGNCFLITYFKELSPILKRQLPSLSQKLCSKYHTDGIVILLPTSNKKWDLQWLFYNSDGSTAEMCGNAACCTVIYSFEKKIVSKNPFILKTPYNTFQGELKNNNPRISFKQDFNIQGPFAYHFNNENISYTFINTSVPHAVIKRLKNPYYKKESLITKIIGKKLRHQTNHHKKGMNVSFYCETHQQNTISACTFERGVENITPACGTGALAVARIHYQNYSHLKYIYVKMPGGNLKVKFQGMKTVSLESPIKWIREISYPIHEPFTRL